MILEPPKVSVVIPVYNVERYLDECLQSVIGQTLTDIEVICINDASTDNSMDILEKFRTNDKRIQIITHPRNRGLSSARNTGLSRASGKYIYFLDSDDYIVPEAMEELFNKAESGVLDAVFFEAELLYEDDQLKTQFIGYKEEFRHSYERVMSGSELFPLLVYRGEWFGSVCRQFWNREFLITRSFDFYENIIHEDELFSFLTLLSAERVECVHKKYFVRRLRQKSIMTSGATKRNFIGLFITICEMLDYWKGQEIDETLDAAIARHIFNLYTRLHVRYAQIKGEVHLNDFQEVGSGSLPGHLFQLYMNTKRRRELDISEIYSISKYPKVVIYGAGVVGRQILEVLDKQQIGINGFMVSEKQHNPEFVLGHRVYSIEELHPYRQETLILLAATPKYLVSMREKLEEFGFEHYMDLDPY
ncbi:glycosyltransferase [Paenibacillus spiritus]|uniref:Glycosyltransferase n=1 Tax=Paenibacillus spiritus TaxID=2496557 RepID=A0A5J5FWP4_9BACL|nr:MULTISPECIES: glycosyltransferase [Paenibacillus]KAA8997971.1 glycosyltransferase [Paenibacillus spiritus]